jgi:DNA modification methylase
VLTIPERKTASVAIDELHPHSRNPRNHSPAQIKCLSKALKTFRIFSPIVAERDGTILAGHARWEAAKYLGMSHVPVIWIDHLNPEEALAFMVADNRLTDLSSFNEPAVTDILKEISEKLPNFEMDATGYSFPEIDVRINILNQAAMAEPEDEPDVKPLNPVTRLGDCFDLGNSTVHCADALDEKAYEPLRGGQLATAVFTDPPYNVPIRGHVSGLGATQHREFVQCTGEYSSPDFTHFLASGIKNALLHTALGGVAYICMDWRHLRELDAAAAEAGLIQLNLCAWVKTNAGMGSFYRSQHELVYVGRKGNVPHINNIRLGRFGRNRTNVWQYPGANVPVKGKRALEDHPTPKPIAMVADAILDCTNPGDLVLDPYLGGGTTLLAAEKTGRRAFGTELDPVYVDVVIRRWEKLTGRAAIHRASGKPFSILRQERLGDER